MKIGITGDLHASPNRIDEFAEHWSCAVNAFMDRGVRVVLLGGDIFDVNSIGGGNEPPDEVLEAVVHPIKRLLESRINVCAIPGNVHDRPNDFYRYSLTSLELFGVDILREPTSWACPDFDLLAVPWFDLRNAEYEITKLIKGRNTARKSLLLCHGSILGSVMNSGRVCESAGFAVRREFLEQLNVDFIRFFHFHKRQINLIEGKGGYGGALWQLNFGHAGEPQGVEVLDTETGASEWIEIEVARKHRVEIVKSKDDVQIIMAGHKPDKERLWIKSDGFELARAEKAALISSGVVKVTSQNLARQERAARIVEVPANALADDAATLRLYMDSRKDESLDRPAIEGALQELLSENPNIKAESKSAGCVTPIKTTIRGIGVHTETVIDWSLTGPIVSVYGENGAGKTTSIGSIFWVLYGRMPGYGTASAAEMVSSFGDGEGSVTSEFSYRGVRYSATRVVRGAKSKTPKQEGMLTRIAADGATEDLAGPKISDFNRVIEQLFGTPEIALATWFMTAKRENDLIDATEGERREAYGRFLGFDRLDAISKLASDEVKESESRIDELTIQLGELFTDVDLRISIATDALDQESYRLSYKNCEKAKAQSKLNSIADRLRDARGGEDQWRAAIQSHRDALKTFARREEWIGQSRSKIEKLKPKADSIEKCKQDVADLDMLSKRRHELREVELQFGVFRQWQRMKESLDANIEGLKATIAAFDSMPGADDETKRIAGTVATCESDYRQAKLKNSEIENRKLRRGNERAGWMSEVLIAHREIDRLEKRQGSKPETPAAPEVCITCPLMREFASIPETIQKYRARVAELQPLIDASLEADGAEPELCDLAILIEAGSKARLAEKTVAAAEKAIKGKAEAQRNLDESQSKLVAHLDSTPGAVNDPTAELADVQRKLDGLAGARERLDVAIKAAEEIETLNTTLLIDEVELPKDMATANSLLPAAENAQRMLADQAAMIEKIKAEQSVAAMELDQIRAAIESLNREIAGLDAKITILSADKQKSEAKRTRISEFQLRVKTFQFLQLAFGKKGVQPLIIEQSVPELEDIANSMLSDATDGEMSLRIATQAANAKGEIVEAFRIMVSVGCDERDISIWSGGERLKMQIIFRIAQSIWLSRRHGAALESIFIDEAFNNLDAANKGLMAAIIQKLQTHFAKVVIITPDESVCQLFPSQMIFRKTHSGPRIEYVRNGVESA